MSPRNPAQPSQRGFLPRIVPVPPLSGASDDTGVGEPARRCITRLCFVLGFLLLGVFPTDIVTSLSVGAYVAANGDRWVSVLPFVALTLFFLAIPGLVALSFGDKAQVWLPNTRRWMNNHAWIVTEVVLGIFVVLSISNI